MAMTTATVFRADGILRLGQVIPEADLAQVRAHLDAVTVSAGSRRDVWGMPVVMEAAQAVARQVTAALALHLEVAWITYFDKREDRNWLVPRHRDEFLPIRDRDWAEQIGCREFQEKEGVLYGIAPPWVYDRIVAARLAVDRNHGDNGPLEAVSGSHRTDSLDGELVAWEAEPGDVVLMHPRCVHASRKIRTPDRRRVLHINLIHGDLVGRVGIGL